MLKLTVDIHQREEEWRTEWTKTEAKEKRENVQSMYSGSVGFISPHTLTEDKKCQFVTGAYRMAHSISATPSMAAANCKEELCIR